MKVSLEYANFLKLLYYLEVFFIILIFLSKLDASNDQKYNQRNSK